MPKKPKPQTIHDFDLDTLLGEPSKSIAEFLEVSPKTVERWKLCRNRVAGRPPLMAVRLLAIRHECDLSAIGGQEWAGFNFNRFGLCTPFYRTRITADELRDMLSRHAYGYRLEREAASLRQRVKALENDLAALWAAQKVRRLFGQTVSGEAFPRTEPPAMF